MPRAVNFFISLWVASTQSRRRGFPKWYGCHPRALSCNRARAKVLQAFVVSLYQGKIDLKRIGPRGEFPSGAISQQFFERIKDVFGRLSNGLALRVDARNFLHVTVKAAFLAGFKDDGELLHLVLTPER